MGTSTPASTSTIKRGIGFAGSMLASGLVLSEEGKYQTKTGGADLGTGSDTTLRQIGDSRCLWSFWS